MLYDTRWDAKVEQKVDPLSLAGLIAWLETKPPSTKYDYDNCRGFCLIGRYLTDMGFDWSWDYSKFTNFSIRVRVAGLAPYTYGAALKRARAEMRG